MARRKRRSRKSWGAGLSGSSRSRGEEAEEFLKQQHKRTERIGIRQTLWPPGRIGRILSLEVGLLVADMGDGAAVSDTRARFGPWDN